MARSRSRSPECSSEVKLHVSNLPLSIEQSELESVFRKYGEISSVRVIRKGNNGQPLRDCVYGFVQLRTFNSPASSIESLKQSGWNVSLSRQPSESEARKQNVMRYRNMNPSLVSLGYNYQVTMAMLLNNPKIPPGATVDAGVIKRLLEENHPSASNMPALGPMFVGGYLVREVWVGNINSTTDTHALYDNFLQFGNIEGIEMFNSKGFAFVKFRKIVQATLAYEKGQGIVVDERPVKIAFADPTRRIDIIGDSLVPDDPSFNPIDNEYFKTLFVGYSAGISVPSEHTLKEVFSRYGTVTGIYIKQGNSYAKPYAFVDYDKGEQAAYARIALYMEDSSGARRRELGDTNLQISFKNTTKSVNKSGVKNGVRYYDKHASGVDVKDLADQLLRNPSYIVPQLQQMSNITQLVPAPYVHSAAAPLRAAATEPEEAQPHVIWSGFMTRSKLHKVGIDLSLLKGDEDCIPSNLYHLNITHRVTLPEVAKYEILALVSVEASNGTQVEGFNNYIGYFRSKQRAGYIPMKKSVMYIVPAVPLAVKLYSKLTGDQLLGVIVNPLKKC